MGAAPDADEVTCSTMAVNSLLVWLPGRWHSHLQLALEGVERVAGHSAQCNGSGSCGSLMSYFFETNG